ncbi:hypothetical protein ACFPN2_33280 [Steroidobacter flavus]|uniref:Uncharacterized protein n=1 Tax=Steroidobacter flavus TaxID=1842136 RepID=A0ABV8T4B2_9GAMM
MTQRDCLFATLLIALALAAYGGEFSTACGAQAFIHQVLGLR